ncbi:MAG: hypothetical protein ACPG7F_08225 [Aggregatilineales bacterium]
MSGEKRVLLLLQDEMERDAIMTLLDEMGASVTCVVSGEDAIQAVEETSWQMLIMDSHAWSLLGVLKEIVNLSKLSTIVIMDTPQVAAIHGVTPLVRPIAVSRIRRLIQDLWH